MCVCVCKLTTKIWSSCVCVFFLRILCSNCAHVISSCGLLAVYRMCVAGAKKAGASSTLLRKKTHRTGSSNHSTHGRAFSRTYLPLAQKNGSKREKHTAGLLQEHSVLETCRHEVMCTRPLHTSYVFFVLHSCFVRRRFTHDK